MVLTVPRSPRNQRRDQRRALITGLTAGTFRGLSVPEELAPPAPRDHASFSARRRVTPKKRAFNEIPRNTERVIPVSVRYTVPAGPTSREPQPIRDIYRACGFSFAAWPLEHAHLAAPSRSHAQKGAVAWLCVTPTTAIVGPFVSCLIPSTDS